LKSQVATFFDVFPNSVIFGNTREGPRYDMVLVGQVERLRIDPMRSKVAVESRLRAGRTIASRGRFPVAVQLLATYAAGR
jgi:hypothetical protein